jgi:hypothetical protein
MLMKGVRVGLPEAAVPRALLVGVLVRAHADQRVPHLPLGPGGVVVLAGALTVSERDVDAVDQGLEDPRVREPVVVLDGIVLQVVQVDAPDDDVAGLDLALDSIAVVRTREVLDHDAARRFRRHAGRGVIREAGVGANAAGAVCIVALVHRVIAEGTVHEAAAPTAGLGSQELDHVLLDVEPGDSVRFDDVPRGVERVFRPRGRCLLERRPCVGAGRGRGRVGEGGSGGAERRDRDRGQGRKWRRKKDPPSP